jgi:CubicO group peptidase (beta-lactamase class C family)
VPAAIGPPQAFQNDPAFQRACVPAGNGIADARSLARLYAMVAGGGRLGSVRLLTPETIERCNRRRPGFADRDLVTGTVSPVGQGGFQLGAPPAPADADPVVAGGPGTLWHPGGGGTYAWADPSRGLAVAICHNRLVAGHAGSDPRPPAFGPLADAVRAVAAEAGV